MTKSNREWEARASQYRQRGYEYDDLAKRAMDADDMVLNRIARARARDCHRRAGAIEQTGTDAGEEDWREYLRNSLNPQRDDWSEYVARFEDSTPRRR